jgi:hypothetical protein
LKKWNTDSMEPIPAQPTETLASQQLSISTPNPPTKQTYLKYIIILILFFIIATSAYLLGSNNAKPVALLPTPTPVYTPEPTKDPTATWQTFTNKNGYSIKYPSQYEIVPEQFGIENSTQADGISVQSSLNGFEKPLLKVYTFGNKDTKHTFTSLQEYAQLNYEDNTSNKNVFIKIIEPLKETTFLGEKAYEYTVESKGFDGVWTGFLGEQGNYRIIIFSHANKNYLIGYYQNTDFEKILSTFIFTNETQSSSISSEEKQKIDAWLQTNNLNQYGDPKDIAYIGGSPLFNETTGETIDKYDYILSKNPTRPWNK